MSASSYDHEILVTGSTFLLDKHLASLRAKSINVTRVPDVAASEETLIEALRGKDGYILGGLERVTDKVVSSASDLKAICFTGAGWAEFIPGHERATRNGIAITAAPGANAQGVAELAVGLIHDRVRNISYLSGDGSGERIRGRQLRNLSLGIIGAGNIGCKVARIINGSYGSKILYASPRRNLDLEYSTGAEHVEVETLLRRSDIVSLHARKTPETEKMLNHERIRLLRDGAVLVNTSFASAVDPFALYDAVAAQRISAAFDVVYAHVEDDAALPDFEGISKRYLLRMGIQSGFNTEENVEVASSIVTNAITLLLTSDTVPAEVVNPSYLDARTR